MINMSFRQFAEVWSDLERAYRGEATWQDEGHSVEIYGHRLAYQNGLARSGDAEEMKRFVIHASESMYDCLALFSDVHQDALIEVKYGNMEYKKLGTWIRENPSQWFGIRIQRMVALAWNH